MSLRARLAVCVRACALGVGVRLPCCLVRAAKQIVYHAFLAIHCWGRMGSFVVLSLHCGMDGWHVVRTEEWGVSWLNLEGLTV